MTDLNQALADFLRHLDLEKNASAHTVKSYREDLTQAVTFFTGKAVARPEQVSTRPSDRSWPGSTSRAMPARPSRGGSPPSVVVSVLCRQDPQKNPADGLRGPKLDRKLPHFLSKADVDRLLAAPGDSGLGLRDQAILETLYSAGLRVSELVGLELGDVDLGDGVAVVRGKGRRERLALLGAAAKQAIQQWLETRAALLDGIGRRSEAVFLNKNATRLSTRSVGRLLIKPETNRPRPADDAAPSAHVRDACSTPGPTSGACRSCSATEPDDHGLRVSTSGCRSTAKPIPELDPLPDGAISCIIRTVRRPPCSS